MRESEIQAHIMLAATAAGCRLFRSNVGSAWTGDITWKGDGALLIEHARRFSSGLPVGWPDLVGWTSTGRFLAVEVKGPRGRVSKEQQNMINTINRAGGVAGICRSVQDFEDLLELKR